MSSCEDRSVASRPGQPKAGAEVRRRAVLLGLAAGCLALTGCGGGGFQPLYGQTASGKQMTDVLANVDVAMIAGRTGQRVRNDLVFYTQGGDAPGAATPEYRLDIAIREYSQSVLVATTGLAAGSVLHLDASFKLVRLKDSKVVLSANSYARAPFETNTVRDPFDEKGTSTGRSVFANVRANTDAQNRAASTLATDIRARIAAFLSGAA